MKYYIIAGEASGDLHGANLISALKQQDDSAEFRFFGGDLMAERVGDKPVKHYKEMAFMGYLQVILNLSKISQNLKLCKKDILSYNPDVVVLIDYAGFNLKIAKFAFTHKYKVYYYISPKIWAWKTYRIKQIKKYVNKMFTIMPFETDFYKSHNYEVDYVGNPINDAIANYTPKIKSFHQFIEEYNFENKPIISILAGSRKQEIKLMLPTMVEVSKAFPNYQFIIAGAPGITTDFYNQIIQDTHIPIIFNETYNILSNSKAALVTSGTATLETGLLQVPQVVCYRTSVSNFLYNIGRKFLKLDYISLVNLILDKEAVKEMVQQQFTTEHLIKELNLILNDDDYRTNMLTSYKELKNKVGDVGVSNKVASLMISNLKEH